MLRSLTAPKRPIRCDRNQNKSETVQNKKSHSNFQFFVKSFSIQRFNNFNLSKFIWYPTVRRNLIHSLKFCFSKNERKKITISSLFDVISWNWEWLISAVPATNLNLFNLVSIDQIDVSKCELPNSVDEYFHKRCVCQRHLLKLPLFRLTYGWQRGAIYIVCSYSRKDGYSTR